MMNVLLQREITEATPELAECMPGIPAVQTVTSDQLGAAKPLPDYEAMLLSRVYALILSWGDAGDQHVSMPIRQNCANRTSE